MEYREWLLDIPEVSVGIEKRYTGNSGRNRP